MKTEETSGRKLDKIKAQVLKALHHPEAGDGLYFRNFFRLHEEDERVGVDAERAEILAALNELISEGEVQMDGDGQEVIYQLSRTISW